MSAADLVPHPVASLVLLWLVLPSLAIYLVAIAWFLSGTVARNRTTQTPPDVSIIVAARDEAATIDATLHSLLAQDADGFAIEVILVDDGSTDGTLERAREMAAQTQHAPRLRVFSTKESLGSSGHKKAALTLGIGEAAGEIILCTDADCRVPRDWARSMASHFCDDVDGVVGFSQIAERGWLAGFESLDFLLLMTAARGACGRGHPVAASGQSFGFRRSAFEEVGGYSKVWHRLSGDDVLLLQLLRRAGKRLVFAADGAGAAVQGAVLHPAATSITSLLRQRIRWASNGPIQLQLDPWLFMHLTATLVCAVAILATAALAATGGIHPAVPVALWGTKALADLVFALRGMQLSGRWDLLRIWPLWALLHPAYLVVAGGLGCLGIFQWKGTRVKLGRVSQS